MGIGRIIRMDDETPTIVNMGAIFLQSSWNKIHSSQNKVATIARIESFLNIMVGHISGNEEYIEKLHQIRFSM
jgi:amino acid permease